MTRNEEIEILMRRRDEISQRNNEQAELHRIAYGKAMYNQAIDDAIKGCYKHRPELVHGATFNEVTRNTINNIIEDLNQLKKQQP